MFFFKMISINKNFLHEHQFKFLLIDVERDHHEMHASNLNFYCHVLTLYPRA